LDLKIYAGSFETSWLGEMAGDFSQGKWLLRLDSAQQGIVGFPWVRVPVCHRIQFCLVLYLLIFEKKKEK
jgi:hypothetical protein